LRKAFNLLMAIFILLILSGAAALTLKYVSIHAKHTADSYIKEQAEIFMQSVLEATILKIEGYDRSSNSDCEKNLKFYSDDKRFIADVNITRYYLYKGKDNNGLGLSNCNRVKPIDTEESHGYTLIEVVVETNSTNPKIKGFVSPIRITTRSLQRP